MRKITPIPVDAVLSITSPSGIPLFHATKNGNLYHYHMAIGSAHGGNQPKDYMLKNALEVMHLRSRVIISGTLADELWDKLKLDKEPKPAPTNGTVASDEEMAEEFKESFGVDPIQRTDSLETFYDLCVSYGHFLATYKGDVSVVFPDSRATMDTLIEWANEFNTKNVGRQWDGEYMEEIDAFFDAKVEEV